MICCANYGKTVTNMKQIKTFLDSSVIIAGLASKTGGSHKILLMAEYKIIIPLISEVVVQETLNNIKKKMPEQYNLFYALFKKLPFMLIDPSEKDINLALSMINDKDAPILAAAMTGKAEWLLSLDRHFLAPELIALAKMNIGTPGDFIQRVFS
jgi:putative PIN family toxin of toxin-antitoxin system